MLRSWHGFVAQVISARKVLVRVLSLSCLNLNPPLRTLRAKFGNQRILSSAKLSLFNIPLQGHFSLPISPRRSLENLIMCEIGSELIHCGLLNPQRRLIMLGEESSETFMLLNLAYRKKTEGRR